MQQPIDVAANQISYANLNGGGGDLMTTGATVSSPTFQVLLKAPVGVGQPAFSGGSTPGSTLSCLPGTWAPDLLRSFLYRVPQCFAFQWLRDGAGVARATGSTITATSPGQHSCRVTAMNQAGSSSQTSAPLTVADNSFKPKPKPKLSKKKGTATIAVTVPGAGELP